MKSINSIIARGTTVIIALSLEIFKAILLFRLFSNKGIAIEVLLRIASVVLILMINKNSKHLSSDMMYVLLIVIAPVAGTALYLLLTVNLLTSKTYKGIQNANKKYREFYKQDEDVLIEAKDKNPLIGSQLEYISKYGGYPVYHNDSFDYYGLGEEGYPIMLEELRKAKHFIFIEYFIIEEGKMWNQILSILEEKVKENVEVRVMYDDLGSIMTLNADYSNSLEKKGIKCVPFNRLSPVFGIILNHRNHRKIMVIDGKVAFSGGVNLADEYINVKKLYGNWKDNVIRVKGEAVNSFTLMFLTHWNAIRNEDENIDKFLIQHNKKKKYNGFIAPYSDTPLDDELLAQNVYLNIINQAKDYCYIATPYLIIDTELQNALILAAKRGVDVRLITPGIPDKKIIFEITRSYYNSLIKGGVKIYEYSPGFIHCKVFVSDDISAVVGTINLDYRSLYLHFENGTYLANSKKVFDIKKDMLDTINVSHEVTLQESKNSIIKEFLLSILRLFAPLM